ncbi:MAG: amidohydrolase family protein, partial [Clostridiales bacterium]|nr:amidohydrolase family protein [Clostridiales bacterium]
ERLRLPIVMHLPRAGRMPDEDNIRELREIRQRYPDLTMIIAHLGRCYTPYHLGLALERLGGDIGGFYFDTAAVLNPDVLRMGFDHLSPRQILFGTDQPIFLWHGYREWTRTKYVNLAREDFPWNTHRKDAETEAGYTLFVYRQLDNILAELDRFGADKAVRDAVFRGSCARVFGRG